MGHSDPVGGQQGDVTLGEPDAVGRNHPGIENPKIGQMLRNRSTGSIGDRSALGGRLCQVDVDEHVFRQRSSTDPPQRVIGQCIR